MDTPNISELKDNPALNEAGLLHVIDVLDRLSHGDGAAIQSIVRVARVFHP